MDSNPQSMQGRPLDASGVMALGSSWHFLSRKLQPWKEQLKKKKIGDCVSTACALAESNLDRQAMDASDHHSFYRREASHPAPCPDSPLPSVCTLHPGIWNT